MIRVLLADDDALVRSGLRLMLSGTDDIVVVGEAKDGSEVLPLVTEHRPDLVLMDIRMPTMDGIEATRALRALPGPPEIVMLTTFSVDYVLRALGAGAAGFLLKHTPPGEIVAAVRRAAAGEPALSPEAARSLIDTVVASQATDSVRAEAERARSALEGLGDREREVALAVGRGRTNAEIASELFMGVPTVKAHVSHILTKLGLTNRVQIALLVQQAGLPPTPST